MSIYKVWSVKKLTPYRKKKSLAKQLAADWQQQNINKTHSWRWCCEWYARFEKIAKKYGLTREFRENGII